MKLLRVGPPDREKPALLDTSGSIRDLSGVVDDIDGDTLAPEGLRRLSEIDCSALPVVEPGQRIGPCVARPRNFVCIGLNYHDHAIESSMEIPTEPVVFLKSLSAFSGPYDDVVIPRGSSRTDWEVELGVVIGRTARNVPREQAYEHVAGYCICNDVSEREFQIARGGTWDKGKGCDTFGPVGPWLVTRDEVPNPQSLDLWLDVDDVRMQAGTTKVMIFPIAELISYVSRFITLHPGDILSTGTPAGVGMGQKPEPIYLRAGQTMSLGIGGLGRQQQHVVAADDIADTTTGAVGELV